MPRQPHSQFYNSLTFTYVIMTIYKDSLLAPTQALVYYKEQELILAARGTDLYIYNREGITLHKKTVFNSHSIHGCNLSLSDTHHVCIVYGGKDVATYSCYGFNQLCLLEDLDDLILDVYLCQIKNILVVAYAHNFIDIYTILTLSNDVILLGKSYRVQCPIVCVLFSLSIITHPHINITSGTVFGDIINWSIDESQSTRYQMNYKIKAHEGVVFRIKWNSAYTKYATTSDDRTVRLYEANGTSLWIGWGHTCRVWDVCFCGKNEEFLATASEEGDLRIWDPETEECVSVLRGHGKNVWRIISITGQNLLVSAGNDSCLKYWDHETARMLSGEMNGFGREFMIPGTLTNTRNRRSNGVNSVRINPSGDTIILIMLEGGVWKIFLPATSAGSEESWEFLMDLHRPVTSSDVLFQGDSCSVCASHPEGYVTLYRGGSEGFSFCWKAHELRAISAWFLGLSASDKLLTSSVRGVCRLWEVSACGSQQLLQCSIEKEVIASCCTSLQRDTLLIGDSRGGISVIDLASGSQLQYLARVHSIEIVSVLRETDSDDGDFSSLGHDGYLNLYRQQQGIYKCISRTSCQPIKSPDYINVTLKKDGSTSIFIGGYVGSRYILYDVWNKYQLLDVEGGGWKRPHDAVVVRDNERIPRLVFTCPFPKDNTNLLFAIDSMHVPFPQSHSPLQYCMQLGPPLNSLESYCCVYIPNMDNNNTLLHGFVLVGGEEGWVRVYSKTEKGLHFLHDAELPHCVPAKTMATTSSRTCADRGMVVAAGGRLSYTMWTYDITAADASPFNTFLHLFTSGSICTRAAQDHRILSTSCTSLSIIEDHQGPIYAIQFCDSRGILSLGLLQENSGYQLLAEITGSDYPLLSSVLLERPGCVPGCISLLSIFGDSSGVIRIWTHKILSRGDLMESACIFKYQAHEMGANALDTRFEFDSCTNEERLLIVSGGDDQSVVLCSLLLTDVSTACIRLLRQDAVSGSAIKGVALLKNDSCLTVGYDQRLIQWRLDPRLLKSVLFTHLETEGCTTSLHLPEVVTAMCVWSSGLAVNVCDVEGFYCRDKVIIVVGQGVETFVLE